MGKLKARKKFGLVFEQHLPEVVQLHGLPVKPGVRIAKRTDKKSFSIFSFATAIVSACFWEKAADLSRFLMSKRAVDYFFVLTFYSFATAHRWVANVFRWIKPII